jgi:hypothetical protein
MQQENSEGTMHVQLVYVSAAAIEFDDAQLEELLSTARTNNSSLGISGILLYADSTFLQVLEGERTQVESLFHKIESDPRHLDILLLATRQVETRNFSQWSMGYIPDRRRADQMPGFTEFLRSRNHADLQGDSGRMLQIIDSFRRGRWRKTPSRSPHNLVR